MPQKSKIDPAKIFERRASLNPDENAARETSGCETCDSRLVFALATREGEAFSIDLPTIIACLGQAEERGPLPPRPARWWNKTRNHLNL
jgi:hypothetical protein